jgi:hypothetical protein
MTIAGGLTIGGLLVVITWAGFRAILWFGDHMAEEIGRFFDVRGAWAGETAAHDDAADNDAHVLLLSSRQALEPETIGLATSKSRGFTSGDRHD